MAGLLEILRLEISGFGRGDELEKFDGFSDTLFARQHHVFVFDRKPTIITVHAKPVTKVFPEPLVISVSERNVAPRARRDIHERAVLETARGCTT
jgi:hypothetical protein